MEKGFYGIDHIIDEFINEVEKKNKQYSVENWIRFLKRYVKKLENDKDIKKLYKSQVLITGTIEDNENNKTTKFTLKGTSNKPIYADEIMKALSKLGIVGEFESEIKL